MLNSKIKLKYIKRFWKNVNYTNNPNECWEWLKPGDKDGYGQFRVEKHIYRAHRVAFFLYFGYLPSKMVCHTCDNPPCCNPHHLWVGSNIDNIQDAIKKGRKNGLTKAQVEQVKRLIGTKSQRKLAIQFNSSDTTIHNIIYDKSYK